MPEGRTGERQAKERLLLPGFVTVTHTVWAQCATQENEDVALTTSKAQV